MNSTDKMELDILRQEMWDIFSKNLPQDQKLTEQFVEAMDRHQEILAGDVE